MHHDEERIDAAVALADAMLVALRADQLHVSENEEEIASLLVAYDKVVTRSMEDT